jgi:phage terminase large subunit GpA-like protein
VTLTIDVRAARRRMRPGVASRGEMRLTPPPNLTASEWADEKRMLSAEASAEPGPWRTSRVPYLRGILDALSDSDIETVVLMTASQVGKTEVVNNLVGYHIDQDPAPMLILLPTELLGHAWSKDRLAPMLRDTPVLQGKVAPVKSRDSGNTILHKRFSGGHLTIAGANSAANLAMRPIRILACDEVDRYPASAGTEGDPVALAYKRTSTFWNRKRLLTSTPTIKGFSRIEAAYDESDQRRFWMPCPHCDTYQVFKWANVKWESNDPGTACYACDECGTLLEETDKLGMLRRGEWRAERPGGRTAGFHLSALYSPWARWEELVEDFLAAKGHPERLKVWVNTVLGETWEESGERISIEDLERPGRREEYGRDPRNPEDVSRGVPDGVGILTAAVDVQGDRLELKVKGWGKGQESWLIFLGQLWGDPGEPEVWEELRTILNQTWTHVFEAEMTIAATAIDSGGHHADAVYTFCWAMRGRRVFPIKGMGEEGRPLLGRPSKANKQRVPLFPVGTTSAKDLIFSRLKITKAGPGYIHLPVWADEEYLAQLTSEKVITKFTQGRPKRVYVKTRPRNEALDLEVYNLAALAHLGPGIMDNLGNFADQLSAKETEEKPKDLPPAQPPLPSRGFVSEW